MSSDSSKTELGAFVKPEASANDEISSTVPAPVPGTISAYYSLVLPDFTYYVQTLAVSIGRRCAPGTPSSSTAEQADVDLGALKSVSRLHARIEYDDADERFVLEVIGRNGAWVDGVWSAAGSRVPLGERYVYCVCMVCSWH
jgi:forkhead box protein K